MYQNIHACVCVRVHSHTVFQCVCIHSHTHNSNTHTQTMTCVCFTFSILGCYCFVAVLGAAAHRVEAEEEEGEVLDRHRCLLALAALRHAKWFQVGTHSLPVFLPDAYCSLTIQREYTHCQIVLRCLLYPLSFNLSRIDRSVDKLHIFTNLNLHIYVRMITNYLIVLSNMANESMFLCFLISSLAHRMLFYNILNKNCQILQNSSKNTSSKKRIFAIYNVAFHPLICELEKRLYEKNVRSIVRLQKQLLILVFLFGYYVNLPAL